MRNEERRYTAGRPCPNSYRHVSAYSASFRVRCPVCHELYVRAPGHERGDYDRGANYGKGVER